MIQAVVRPSTDDVGVSAGKLDQESGGQSTGFVGAKSRRVMPETADVLFRSAVSDVERRAQNVSSVLWLMMHSTKVDAEVKEALGAIEEMVRDLRDIAVGAQQIEIAW